MLNPPFIGVPWEYPKGGVHAPTHSASKHALAWALLAIEFDLIVLTPWFEGSSVLNCRMLPSRDRRFDKINNLILNTFGFEQGYDIFVNALYQVHRLKFN